ncbi:hypothetical protein [Solibacillus sp. CAU 1738]|uniref:hypothetical protein n=1 Tax=Solibacillus sp. CAU 1738 TaxID=3140363 RepID=UPI003260AED1
MVLKSDVEMVKAYKESRMDIWVGNRENSLKNLEKCLMYIKNNNESGLKVLFDPIEKTIESWNKIESNQLGCTIDNLVPNVNFSGILLYSGLNSGEFRGRIYGSSLIVSEYLNPIQGCINKETLNLNWVTVNTMGGFTAKISFNPSNAILIANLIFHQIFDDQTIKNNRIVIQEEICRFFLREIKNKFNLI